MRTPSVLALAAGLGALSAGGAVAASGPPSDLHRDFAGIVSAVERPSAAFAVRTSSRRTVRFVVNARTSWSPACRSLGCVQPGHRLAVHARPDGARWVALEVTRHYVEDGARAQGLAR